MRVLFTIQGEGRGHMTQAIAVRQMLARWGDTVVGAVVGGAEVREVPSFVSKGLEVPVTRLASPAFQFSRGRRVRVGATLWHAVAEHRVWRRSVTALRELIEELRPDIVLNFFEPITGLAQLTGPLPVPVVAIGHQHMIGHGKFPIPMAERPDELSLQAYSNLVGHRSWKLALSFYPPTRRLPKRVVVSPPILRAELFTMTATRGGYYVVYTVNYQYHEEIRDWHKRNAAVPLHCFYDRPDAPDVEMAGPNLTFHRLAGEKFLRFMAGSRGVLCTAGFESVSEAAWLDKPLLAVPVENHAEQRWNARDAQGAGLAATSQRMDLDRLSSLPSRCDNAWFRDWVATGEEKVREVIGAALNDRRERVGHAATITE